MDERLLAKTFVQLADSLVADFDLIKVLRLLTDRCVGVLGVAGAGVLLADQKGELRVMAASDERVRLLELFQVQSGEGPCVDCFQHGLPVTVPDLAAEAHRWPRFAAEAGRGGYGSVWALPMRLRDEVVGTLNLFGTGTGPDDPAGLQVGQALADVATISLLQHRSSQRSRLLNEQLQTALNSRVLIEQAKGKLAERLGVDVEQAFSALRRHARAHNLRLADLARSFVDGEEPLTDLSA
ncbi:ANTAR domain-containing protein [Streptomyces sp. NBC_01190]|uniref:ANTAR domain-containing protein n=1 Tax=Streptomyces sp. NBC_01190 TaxID=2903767 RepID=UPI003868BBF8|nr:GAF and ANTAR domain-containing protein [Streptomyces sp. NBC_01190]